MELDLHRPTNLSKSDALHLIGQFFAKEWKNLSESDISLTRCQTGVNNEVYFVSRDAGNGIVEPNKVVIRKYNSVAKGFADGRAKSGFGMRATEIEQIVILVEVAKQGLGPKLLGLIEDGRIEEFIDCHKVTFEEARDPVIAADIAVNMARIHAIDVPLRKPSCDFVSVLREVHAMLKRNIPFYETRGDPKMLQAVTYDFEADFKWMEPELRLENNRMVLMNWDTHVDNICVLNHPRDGQLKTMIFDFEMAGYNIRGKDLGLFLVSISGFFPISRDDRKLITFEEFSPFLHAYQKETAKQFDDVDINGIDSVDHLMRESLLGGMVSSLMFMMFIASRAGEPASGEATHHSPEFIQKAMAFIPVLFEAYTECRSAFKLRCM